MASKPHGYEFGGPYLVFVVSAFLPVLCYAFAFLCNDISGCPVPSLLHPSSLTLDKLIAETGWPGFENLINVKGAAATLGYYGLSLVLNMVLPAQVVEGIELKIGGKQTYRLNAFSSAMFTLAILAAGTVAEGATYGVWTFIDENYVSILTTNILISLFLATFFYLHSFSVEPTNKQKRELAQGGATGNIIYDWFIGRELNPKVNVPTIGEIDIKSWCELRPGMLGWIILDLAYLAKQYNSYGRVSDSMLMVVASQSVYVFDALWNEPAILTTMDITADGFGFMLSFGDLVWVPFVYSLQARYLSVHPVDLGWVGVGAILAVQLSGYYIFRASNSQKNAFRVNPEDPSVKHLTYIETEAGTRLLTSGWWGTARHINYLGDWFMSWSYCLPTLLPGYVVHKSIATGSKVVTQGPDNEMRGWAIPVTYFYMLYFAILLIHREMRDEEKCRRKYGKDWDRYCKIVKWKIIPGVY